MRCEICLGPTAYDFSKRFDACGLSEVEYWRCGACGFVYSRTHMEMSSNAWSRMNELCHSSYQGQQENALDPRWKGRLASQARALSELARGHLLDPDASWLDFGCGDGSLSALVASEYQLKLHRYDQYMGAKEGYLDRNDLAAGSFDFVITTSVFEHMIRREQWDGVDALVSRSGALGIHTLVTEQVPSDPTWFYLQPPHSAFFSNKAMARLFEDWGYQASIYNVAASLWVWFRTDPAEIAQKVEKLNGSTPEPFLFKAGGFLDYWKTPLLRRDEPQQS